MDPFSAFSWVTNAIGSLAGWNSQQKKYEESVRDTNKMNYLIWDESKAHNIDMFERENQAAVDMWNMQNEYNDPSNQIKRLSAAGLNPSLALNSGNPAGVATSAPSVGSANPAPAPTMQAPSVEAFDNGIARAAELGLQTIASIAQVRNTNADTAGRNIANAWAPKMYGLDFNFKTEALESQRWSTNMQRLDYQFMKATQGDRIQMFKRQNDLTDAQRTAFRLDNQTKMICLNFLGAEKTLAMLETGQRMWSNKLTVEQNAQRIDIAYRQMLSDVAVNNAQINKINSDIDVNNAQISKIYSDIGVNNARIGNINADTSLKKEEAFGHEINNWVINRTARSLVKATVMQNAANRSEAELRKHDADWWNTEYNKSGITGFNPYATGLLRGARTWVPFIGQ